MLDIGFPELALIAVVSLVVIGPKDLPKVLKTAGFWMRKARMMTREFQNSVDDMIREAELDDMRRKAEALRTVPIDRAVEQAIDPTGALKEAFEPPSFNTPLTTAAPPSLAPPPLAPPPLAPSLPSAPEPAPEPVPELPAATAALDSGTPPALPEPAAAPEPEAAAPEPVPVRRPVRRDWFVIGGDVPGQTVYRPRRPDTPPYVDDEET